MKKIAVLTGGGDAPGLNAVLRAVVLTALARGVRVLGIRDGFGGFVEADGTVELEEDSVRGLLWRGGSILRCNNQYRGNPDLFVGWTSSLCASTCPGTIRGASTGAQRRAGGASSRASISTSAGTRS